MLDVANKCTRTFAERVRLSFSQPARNRSSAFRRARDASPLYTSTCSACVCACVRAMYLHVCVRVRVRVSVSVSVCVLVRVCVLASVLVSE